MDSLADLRARVARLEGREHEIAADDAGAAWRFGVGAVDAAAGGGLRRDGLHVFRPVGFGDAVAAHGLLFALAAVADPRDGNLLWVTTAAEARERGRLYGPALARGGIEPERLLIVEAKRPAEAGWAIEEGLRSGVFAAVLATGFALDFPASRRLAVIAADHHRPCFAVDAHAAAGPLAAATVWGVAAAASRPDPYDPDAPGAPAWRIELLRARGRPPAGPWQVAWDEAAHRFALAPAAAGRPAAPAVPPRRDAAEPLGAERGRAARA